jgi:hypothetical protein
MPITLRERLMERISRMLSCSICSPCMEKRRASVGMRTKLAATSALIVRIPSEGGVSIRMKSK